MNPLISVIVPIYKVEQFLPKCVDSIINQSYKNLEIILIDDGSPDNCGKICDEYAAKDPHIMVIHQENAGVSAARNAGLDAASGEFIMFVDADDYMPLDAVEVLYERIQQDCSDMALGKYTDVYDDGTQDGKECAWIKDTIYTSQMAFEQFGQSCYLSWSPCGKIYRKDLLANVRYRSFVCGEDLLFYLDVLEQVNKISVVNGLVYYYYQRTSGVMHSVSPQKQKDQLETNLCATRIFWDKGFAKSAAKWFSFCLIFSYFANDKKMVRELLHKYFSKKEIAVLLKMQSMKSRLHWLSIYFPIMKSAGNYLRKIGIRE